MDNEMIPFVQMAFCKLTVYPLSVALRQRDGRYTAMNSLLRNPLFVKMDRASYEEAQVPKIARENKLNADLRVWITDFTTLAEQSPRAS